MSETNESETAKETTEAPETTDEGVGWLPAILAGGLLVTALLFICCGVTTYMLYQKRTELAARTLSGHTIPSVEQSQLDPADKQRINQMLSAVVSDAENGRLENWQASGVMNRLTRIPLLEWGDLAAIEVWIEAAEMEPDEKSESFKELSRLRHAITSDSASIYDIAEVLSPVLMDDQSLRGRRLIDQPTIDQLRAVVERAQLVADRDGVADRMMPPGSITDLVRDAIELGQTEGSI